MDVPSIVGTCSRPGAVEVASVSVGAGAGGILFLGVASFLEPLVVAVLLSMLPMVGCFLIGGNSRRKAFMYLTSSVIIVCIPFIVDTELLPSQFKDISYALSLPEAQVIDRHSSLHGEIKIVSSPAQRFAPGMSLKSPSTLAVKNTVFCNGNWMGSIVENKDELLSEFKKRTFELIGRLFQICLNCEKKLKIKKDMSTEDIKKLTHRAYITGTDDEMIIRVLNPWRY